MISRPATPDDAPAIIAMCNESMAESYGGFMTADDMRPWIEGDETNTYVQSMIDQMLVAERNGIVCGIVALDGTTVDLLWVASRLRGQGIGRQLMDDAERVLHARGIDTARLECFEPNTDAIAFYTKLGWTATNTFLDEMSGVNKVVMTKSF